MKRSTVGAKTGIRWTLFLFSSLKDIDFADDVALLSHTQPDMQQKISEVDRFSKQIGLKIKTKVMQQQQQLYSIFIYIIYKGACSRYWFQN